MSVTYAAVNESIKARGGKERLVHGFGVYYFVDGNASRFPNNRIELPSLDSFTLAEWIDAWQSKTDNLKQPRPHRPLAAKSVG